jgi:hypothetical protein
MTFLTLKGVCNETGMQAWKNAMLRPERTRHGVKCADPDLLWRLDGLR